MPTPITATPAVPGDALPVMPFDVLTGPAARRHHVRVLDHSRNPDSPVLVLLHGFGTDQSAWSRILPALIPHHRVVLLDQAGAGAFDATAYDRTRYSTLDGYAADLVEICEELDLHDVTLIGHSVSAMIAARVALAAPERVRQVIMLVPSARYTDDPTTGYDGGFSSDDIDELLDSLDRNYLSWTASVAPMVMGNPQRPELGEELTASFRQLHPDAARDFARATFRTDSRDLLGEVTTPVLVLQSRDDVLAPDSAVREVVALLPRAALVTLDASGHCPHISHPETTATILLAHLAS